MKYVRAEGGMGAPKEAYENARERWGLFKERTYVLKGGRGHLNKRTKTHEREGGSSKNVRTLM